MPHGIQPNPRDSPGTEVPSSRWPTSARGLLLPTRQTLLINMNIKKIVEPSKNSILIDQDVRMNIRQVLTSPKLHTVQRARKHRERTIQKENQRTTFLRLCQSLKRLEIKERAVKRISRSIQSSPNVRYIWTPPQHKYKLKRRYPKTPFPK